MKKSSKKWLSRLLRCELSGKHSFEIRFPTSDGKRGKLVLPLADRSETERVRRELMTLNAAMPLDKKEACAFVMEKLAALPSSAVILTDKPGFRDGATGFVSPHAMIGTAHGRYRWGDVGDDTISRKGTLAGFVEHVAKPSEASPFLSFSILLSLAAMLPSYVHQRGRAQLLSETSIFYFVAASSTGKSTLLRVTGGCFSAPRVFVDFAATKRGVAEWAYRRNDGILLIDDTESADLDDRQLVRLMRDLAQRIPSGRSRATSKHANNVPSLLYSTFACSSGPESHAALSQRVGAKPQGDRVRWLDIIVPPAEDGGILARVTDGQAEVEDPEVFFAALESGLAAHHGWLVDAFAEPLVAGDYADRVIALCDEFIQMVAANEDSLEIRFARKFALIYAAGVLGIELGLLPWPESWPLEVVAYVYRNARAARDPQSEATRELARRILRCKKRPHRFLRSTRGTVIELGERHIGFVREDDGPRWLVCPDLVRRLDVSKVEVDELMRTLNAKKIVVRGKGLAASMQFRVKNGDAEVAKTRFWEIDMARLEDWLAA
jgi:hypothetical protein